ncbi:MAG TPA: hypothetical protein VM008_16630 [Phycisphaerae bacterium]|nr:hypothetical protein [Phycisphaerae bacterium]
MTRDRADRRLTITTARLIQSPAMSDPTIEHYTAERIPNPYPAGDLPWQVYHTVRNAVFRCCQRFGSSGPMGECPISTAEEPPSNQWPLGDARPSDYFIVDDQLNDERYIYVEIVRPGAFTVEWLRDLVHTLAEYPGWGVGMQINALKAGYILAFADKLMVTGEPFVDCHDFASVVYGAQAALARLQK